MNFFNVMWFWSSLMVLVPIAIHLFSNKKVKRIYVGSTQFLVDTLIKRSRKVSVQDLPLLIVRILLLITLSLILTKPYWGSNLSTGEKYLISGVQLTEQYKKTMAKKGFKVISRDSLANSKFSNEWNFLLQLENSDYQIDSLVYIADDSGSIFIGRAPKLSFPYSIIKKRVGDLEKITNQAIPIQYQIELSDSISKVQLNRLLQLLNKEQNAYMFEECMECNQVDLLLTDKHDTNSPLLKILVSDSLSIGDKEKVLKGSSNQLVISSNLLSDSGDLEGFILPLIETIEEHFNTFNVVNHAEQIKQHANNKTYVQAMHSPLSAYLWMVLVLLFLAERVMVLRRSE